MRRGREKGTHVRLTWLRTSAESNVVFCSEVRIFESALLSTSVNAVSISCPSAPSAVFRSSVMDLRPWRISCLAILLSCLVFLTLIEGSCAGDGVSTTARFRFFANPEVTVAPLRRRDDEEDEDFLMDLVVDRLMVTGTRGAKRRQNFDFAGGSGSVRSLEVSHSDRTRAKKAIGTNPGD